MKINENEIVKFIEPVFHFCIKRLNNRYEAEDLASEIMVHVLEGIHKYEITSLGAWVWRIAYNRYARFIEAKNKKNEVSSDDFVFDLEDDYNFIDALTAADEYEILFRYLHTLSAQYKNITVDYYIGEISIKELALKYSLSESTIKWRLNISREKIKNRIGESNMDKVYKRINWETTCCNGSMNSNKYLYSQIARAICEAVYEKPLTVEEISLKTGLPTMFIEDELPRLIYGDAIEQISNKYAANFIIYRLCDKEVIDKASNKIIAELADYYERLIISNEAAVSKMSFYGSSFGMKRLGYIALPASFRGKVRDIKSKLPGFEDGEFPPRKDGGYGWFHVQETEDEKEAMSPFDSGCNITGDVSFIYYSWISKYFNNNIYHNGGTQWLSEKKIPEKSEGDIIPEGLISEEDIARLLKTNLIVKSDDCYKLNFACFTSEEFNNFISLFKNDDELLTKLLTDLLREVKRSFLSFVPKRLEGQINQYLSGCISCVGEVTEELIRRGVLEKPKEDKIFTNGVFYINGKYIKV